MEDAFMALKVALSTCIWSTEPWTIMCLNNPLDLCTVLNINLDMLEHFYKWGYLAFV
jgi:hypothetical protein